MSAADKVKLNAVDTTALEFSGPLVLAGHTVSIPAATGEAAGYLAPGDFQAFNGKAAGNHGHDAATIEVAGFMSAADKVKMNALDATTAGVYGSASVGESYGFDTGGRRDEGRVSVERGLGGV